MQTGAIRRRRSPFVIHLAPILASLLIPVTAFAQQQPKVTPCKAPAAAAPAPTGTPPLAPLVTALEDAYAAEAWDQLDQHLRTIVGELAGFKCPEGGAIQPTPEANYVFVWRGAKGVPRSYVYHRTIARRPRAYMPAAAPAAQWFDVLVGSSEIDTHRLATQWVASAALPSGTDVAAWVEKILAGATGAIAIVGGLYPVQQMKLRPLGQRGPTPQDYQLYVAVNHLETDVVPARLALTTTAQAPLGPLGEAAKKWKDATIASFGRSAATGPLIEAYATVLAALDCTTMKPKECVQDTTDKINTIWAAASCRSDAACVDVTTSARTWASNLTTTGAEKRQVALTVEKPKHLAVGAFTALVNYPDSVADGTAVRVKVGADSKLSLDAFPRFATGFVATWALRPHEPDVWSVKNIGPYAGIVLTPNIGLTGGIQWRFWRQFGVAGGVMRLWYPTGAAGETISTSSPLDKKSLTALTFGMTFTLDAR